MSDRETMLETIRNDMLAASALAAEEENIWADTIQNLCLHIAALLVEVEGKKTT